MYSFPGEQGRAKKWIRGKTNKKENLDMIYRRHKLFQDCSMRNIMMGTLNNLEYNLVCKFTKKT